MSAEAAGRAIAAAFRRLGRPAVFTPDGGGDIALTVMESRGDKEIRAGFSAGGRTGTLQVDVIIADLDALGRAPASGDLMVVDGETFAVKSALSTDRMALVWTVDLKPEA